MICVSARLLEQRFTSVLQLKLEHWKTVGTTNYQSSRYFYSQRAGVKLKGPRSQLPGSSGQTAGRSGLGRQSLIEY